MPFVLVDPTGTRLAALGDGGALVVGRSADCALPLADPTVSRRHALIYRDDDGAKVLDDRSLNGVFRNGERVELSELNDGDTITVGRFNLHFICLEETPARSAQASGRVG